MKIAVFFACIISAIAGAHGNPVALVPENTVWPCGKDYQRIGNSQWSKFFSVLAPISFVKDAPTIIGETSDSWSVEHYEAWKPTQSLTKAKWDVVRISSKKGSIVVLNNDDKWIRLNETSALPIISNMMEMSYKSPQTGNPIPVGAMSKEMLAFYIDGVIQLFRNLPSSAIILSEDFWTSQIRAPFFEKKYRDTIHSLCKPPVIVNEMDVVKVSSNFINSNGGIECWTVTITPKNSLLVTNIQWKELYPGGSFPYPTPDE